MTVQAAEDKPPAGRRKFAKVAFWAAGARVSAQACQLAVFVLAARLLAPNAFGIFSLASAVAVLITYVGESGWREFVASQDRDEVVLERAFSVAALGSLALAGSGVAVAIALPAITGASDSRALYVWLALSVATAGPGAVYAGVLIRRNQTAELSRAQVYGELIGAVCAALCLWLGVGVGSLGVGKLVAQLVVVVLSVIATGWYPKPRFERVDSEEMWRFRKSVLSSRLISYARMYAASLTVGLFLGPAAVGVYRAAERMAAAAADFIAEPARMLFWTALRRAQNDGEADAEGKRLSEVSTRFMAAMTIIATPLFVGLSITADTLVETVFGPSWQAAGPITSVLAIARLLTLPAVLTTPLLSLSGRIDRLPILDMALAAVTVTALVTCARFGAQWTAYGQLFAAVVTALVTAWAQRRYAAVRWWRASRLSLPSTLASGGMVLALLALGTVTSASALVPWHHFALRVCLGALAYLVTFTVLGGWWRIARIVKAS